MVLKNMLFRLTDIFEEREELLAIRKSMISAIPILMLGSFALLLTSLPLDSYQHFIQNLAGGKALSVFRLMHEAGFGLFSIILAVSVSLNYASLKNVSNETMISYPLVTLAAYAAISGMNRPGFQMEDFGVSAIFVALVSAIVSSKLLEFLHGLSGRFFKAHSYGIDYVFTSTVNTIFPAILIVAVFAVAHLILVTYSGYESLQGLFSGVASDVFQNIGNGFWGAFFYALITHGLWFAGIHGGNVFEDVARRNFIYPIQINAAQLEAGLEATEIFSKTFYDTFVLMGGCGAGLCLLIAIMLAGKKNNARKIAKIGGIPVFFNVNEILVFGLPVIFTPIFFIPFLLVPLVLLMVSYAATALGLVPCVSRNIAWTTPIILGGYKATGSYAGSVLQIVNLVIGTLIYIPFVKLYEEKLDVNMKMRIRKLEQELWVKEDLGQKTDLLLRKDTIGVTAKMLLTDLMHAIEERELYLEYQAQVNAKGECIGAEALLRWKHPLVGNITPQLIIALAKEAGYLPEIEKYLFYEVCSKIHEIEKSGQPSLKISVNITVESLFGEELETLIEDAVTRYGIKPEHLWLELTEQSAWIGSPAAIDKIKRLKAKGHKMLIDDFGMGHTSILYLQTNVFDVVKLDGSLTRDIEKNPTNKEIISSLVYLSTSLKLDVIAEYVETEEQRELLKELGCTVFQGYLYSMPSSFEAFMEFAKKMNERNGRKK